MDKATILPSEIQVSHSIRLDIGREFLTTKVADWGDVEKLCRKVLFYDGRKFTYSGWNSDLLQCYFFRMLDNTIPNTAKILNK